MNFITDYSSWENGDYVVTIRPDWEKSWRSVAVGRTLSKDRAVQVSEWLQSAMPYLWRVSRTSQRYNVDVLPQEID